MNEFIAYKGSLFTIEWYFDSRGKSQALEYYLRLSKKEQMRIARLFETIGDIRKIHSKEKFRYEGDKIYEFKPDPHRFLCFFYVGQKIIITNAFQKKTEKLPYREKEKAIENMEDYLKRVNEWKYYETK
jgi:phage-related protein